MLHERTHRACTDQKPRGTARRPPEGPRPFPRRDVNERLLAPPPPPPTSSDRRDTQALGLGTCSRLSKQLGLEI